MPELARWNWYVVLQMQSFRAFLPQDVCDAMDDAYGDTAPPSMFVSMNTEQAATVSTHETRWTSWKLDTSKLDTLMKPESEGQASLEKAVEALEAQRKEPLDTHFFACGKRGVLYTGTSASVPTPVLIKVQKLNGLHNNPIDRESLWLRRVNRLSIGPTLVLSGPGYCCCEFLDGALHAVDFLHHPAATKTDIAWFVRRIFHQCYVLDVLRINKAEMTHPMRHILVHRSSRVVFIDFEKCIYGTHPRNVTQLMQFITSPRVVSALAAKGMSVKVPLLRYLAKQYKAAGPTSAAFDALLGAL
ncbi:hypothetical protein H257_17536 [Aphanomyces astaci]|uniref:Uncharacterized protein n=1 Tax=Aphanomyces astaci TaxID=112090 RepID=W4FGC6_APHAT|nr:hypothetical protein H257_17536 [Aphanomyces astaci]ETV65901.1 hypothetical protein H257_17536 [Aphanomyces astaci]RQM26981.1 hypothetical protein B5M09_005478 [Aphanomyces astaci]|eukprot:XP_009844654.1 hypothetical protein H257_17536 [Aphanomyces astaci]